MPSTADGVSWRFTGVADGDVRVPPADASGDDLRAYGLRLATLVGGRRVTWMRQVHGTDVHVVDGPGDGCGVDADAAVTTAPHAALAVFTEDCAPVLLRGARHGVPVLAVAHAGWKGLFTGVLQRTVETMEAAAGGPLDAPPGAVLGPCIGPECYEFGADDLARLVDRFGAHVAGRTAHGTPSLDLRRGVASALAELGVGLDGEPVPCTACGAGTWFSHRARRDTGRQALIAWIGPV